jgi:plasmid stabilization system protein ParE
MKLKPVEYLPGAQHDVEESAVWYEEQQRGVGKRFQAALELVEKRLQRSPSLGAPHRRNTRKWRVPRFPYRIIYREEAERILIIAVAHGSRQEDYWDVRIA